MSRPNITLKIASSLDGKIALSNGQSKWITSEGARAAGRSLRATHDAIAIGANTALEDNPKLTTRIDGETDPVRIIFDSRARLPLDSHLVQTAKDTPTYVVTSNDSANSRKLAEQGVVILFAGTGADGHVDIDVAMDMLTHHGIKTLLIEGGGTLAASFISRGLVDKIEWFRAPMILGAEGRPAIGTLALSDMADVYKFKRVSVTVIGDDIHERYQRVEG